MKRLVPIASIAAVALSVATPARADVPAGPVQFAWVRGEGAESCPDGATIMRAVTQRIGRDPFALDGSSAIEVTVARERSRWVAHIYLRAANGSPIASDVLTSTVPSCNSIALAVAVAVGVAIDPDAAMRGGPSAPVLAASAAPSSAPPPNAESASSEPRVSSAPPASIAPPDATASSSPSPSPPASSSPAPDGRVARTHRTPSRRFLTLDLAAGLVGSYGIVPGFALGASITSRIGVHPRFAVSAGAVLLPEAVLGPEPSQLGFTAASFSLGACGALVSTRVFVWDACLAFVGGAVQPVALQRPPGDVGAKAWLATSAGLHVHVRIVGPLAIALGVDAMIPFLRYRFLSRGDPTVAFEQSPVAIVGFVGPEIAFR